MREADLPWCSSRWRRSPSVPFAPQGEREERSGVVRLSQYRKAARKSPSSIAFKELASELTATNEQICQSRPAERDAAGWPEAEKKRPLLFIKKLHARSRRFSR